jgi:hypothetical protein
MSEPGTTKDQLHPVQSRPRNMQPATAPVCVTMRAYEVYCELHGPQEAMVTGGCRGGFGAGELIAYLYAHTFPRHDWRQRFDEALRGLNV